MLSGHDTGSLDWNTLTALFDLLMRRHGAAGTSPPPTAESLERIEAHFGISLPPSLVRFARECQYFGCWFASLGPDYDSGTHIINVNKQARNAAEDDFSCDPASGTQLTKGEGDRHNGAADATGLPAGLVVINLGYDQDYDCLNGRAWDRASGEYGLWYWSPETAPAMLAPSFHGYVEGHLRHWMRGSKKEDRQAIKTILGSP